MCPINLTLTNKEAFSMHPQYMYSDGTIYFHKCIDSKFVWLSKSSSILKYIYLYCKKLHNKLIHQNFTLYLPTLSGISIALPSTV